jgi:hypothetical protein
MTIPRRWTKDETPFGAWVRRQPDLDSRRDGLAVCDVDWSFHRYMTPIDRKGSRDVQLFMWLEVKAFGTVPDRSQEDTLRKWHESFTLWTRRGPRIRVLRSRYAPVSLWFFGVYVLSLPAVSPDQSAQCRWGRFHANGDLQWTDIRTADLADILAFRLRPDRLERLNMRRHHLTREVVVIERMPLGFDVERRFRRRS